MHRLFRWKKPILYALLFALAFSAGISAARWNNWKAWETAAASDGNWGLHFTKDGEAPTGNASNEELKTNQACFMDDTHEKIIYLTFDCGYENGNTKAILDALKAVSIPCCEVHLSNIYEREEFRHHSYISMAAEKTFYGEGFKGYEKAVLYLKEKYGSK